MKKIFIMALIAFSAMFASAQSKDSAAYNAELDKVVENQIQNIDIKNTLKAQFQQFAAQGLIPAENLEPLTNDVINIMLPSMTEKIKNLYKQTFSYDELKQILAWNSSELGMKLMRLSPQASQIGVSIMQDPAIMSQMQAVVMKYMAR